MKRTKNLLLVVLLMISCLLNIKAQEELPKYQALLIGEDLVKSSMVLEYEEVVKEIFSLATEYQFPYPVSVYNTNDFLYYFVTPLNSTKYSELDKLAEMRKTVFSENAEKWSAAYNKFEGTYDYYKEQLIVVNRELSYVPDDPRLNSEEANFNYWVFLYVKVEKAKEFRENLTKWKELYESKNISTRYNIYEGNFGTEKPLFIWHMTGKSAADFWENYNSLAISLGDEAKLLKEQSRKLTRKIDIKTGWYRPELSYTPEKK